MSVNGKPKVVCTRASLPSSILQDAHKAGLIDLIEWDDHSSGTGAPREWLLQSARGAHALVVFLTDKVDAELLEHAGPQLACVSTMSVGLDHVDVGLLQSKKIKIGYTPQVLNEAVAELSLNLALMSTRNVPRAQKVVASGQWGQNPWTPLAFCGPSLRGKTIGFYGFGAIAQAIVLLLPAFHPRTILYTTSRPCPFDPSLQDPRFKTLKEGGWKETAELRGSLKKEAPIEVRNVPDLLEMASHVDVLFVIASLNSSTKHAINATVFAKMKPTAHLINTSRGPLVDTEALVEALRTNQIAGAGLDVLEGEPNITPSHPLLGADIRERVGLLPHIGSATNEARSDMAKYAAQNALGGIAHLLPEENGRRWEMPAEYL
ncbi:hypothetical protein OC846_004233 [Tilletia horrida]|uniref:Glyoxylate reductase n=1 Tax=Tilletia horrida TaxID=155126 RepID=A0AAN6JX65_9BASI|nr:hypothetical protein OC845_005921 [Tilletia horrida]KAK0549076.1 hypothetical protein OC846_004233 [Tilletia horrida]KAK0564643.1 hypothetical protein OC861_004172 [Tilletia horrida]